MTPAANKLVKIREKIDAIDAKIADLINQRGQCALTVAEIKRQEQDKPAYYRPEREAQILQRLVKRNNGTIANRDLVTIFHHILSACRALQQPLVVAIPGTKKSLAYRAAQEHFGNNIKVHLVPTVLKLFQQLSAGQVPYGVVPIEHSRRGLVNQTFDAFLEYPLQICGEVELQDATQHSSTRFLVIGNHGAAPSGNDKTALLISAANQPGSLAKFFEPFAQHNVNITSIATRPLYNELWRYVFFLEVDGHQQDKTLQETLADLAKQSLTYHVLGSYPRLVL